MISRKAFCATEIGSVHYWHCGKGPPLLMLHQASQSSAEFVDIAPLLADRYTVIALDYPGHGASDNPPREPSVSDYSAAAVAVLDKLRLNAVHLCGHHSGGLLAVDLAVSYANRVSSVIMSGVGIRTEENVRAVLETPMSRDLPVDANGEFLAKTWATYRRMSSPGTNPDTTFRFFDIGLAARTRPYDAHYAFLHWDRDPMLPQISQPTLLIHGQYDVFAEEPEKLLDMIPDSRFVRVPGGGAFLFYEQPAACAAAIVGFLEKLRH